MTDEVRAEKKQEEQVGNSNAAKNEYDAAWEEAGKKMSDGSKESDSPNMPKNGISGEQSKGLSEKTPEEKTDSEPKHNIEKALRDTKAWATRIAMEKAELERRNAELERMIDMLKAGKASIEDAQKAVTDAQDDLLNKVKEAAEDYPELQGLFNYSVERILSNEMKILKLEKTLEEMIEQQRRKEAHEYFNAMVKPQILKVHPDFDEIVLKTVNGVTMLNDEFVSWAEQQPSAIRYAALESSDPRDIILAVSEFKKHKFSDKAKEIFLDDEVKKKQKLVNAMSLRGGGLPLPTNRLSVDSDDYDGAWNEAGTILKKQGIG